MMEPFAAIINPLPTAHYPLAHSCRNLTRISHIASGTFS
jgi:hypothetical protein